MGYVDKDDCTNIMMIQVHEMIFDFELLYMNYGEKFNHLNF